MPGKQSAAPCGSQAQPNRVPDAEEPDPEVDNPGAEAVAGRLHGNGKGSLPVGEPYCLAACNWDIG